MTGKRPTDTSSLMRSEESQEKNRKATRRSMRERRLKEREGAWRSVLDEPVPPGVPKHKAIAGRYASPRKLARR